jgi:hypothetical protein
MLEGHLLLNLENKEDLEDLVLQQPDDVTPWNYEVTDENLEKTSNKIFENCVKRENETFENGCEEKPYKCKICSAAFSQIVEIDSHITSLHQEKKLKVSWFQNVLLVLPNWPKTQWIFCKDFCPSL